MADSQEVALHDAALTEIRRREKILRDELELLEKAKSYHGSALERLGVRHVIAVGGVGENGSALSHTITATDADPVESANSNRLMGMTKHDAAAVALKMVGPEASVPELVDWLRGHRYGMNLQRKMLVNSLRTALARKPDMFEFLGNGRWRLQAQWADNAIDKA